MKPFNIQIEIDGTATSLTIKPEQNIYKVIYYGAILGAVQEGRSGWQPVQQDQLEAADLPFYEYSTDQDYPDVELDEKLAQQIGEAVESTAGSRES